MKEKTRLAVLFETLEITRISFSGRCSASLFCRTCLAEALHLSVSDAASILKLSEFAIARLAETGQLHSVETDGVVRVCGMSLLAVERNGQTEN